MKGAKSQGVLETDPNRATLIEVLKELNKSEETARDPNENGLETGEIIDKLVEFWAVKEKKVKVPVILGTLVQNGMVEFVSKKSYSWVRQRDTKDRFRITTDGKEFLKSTIVASNRIR